MAGENTQQPSQYSKVRNFNITDPDLPYDVLTLKELAKPSGGMTHLAILSSKVKGGKLKEIGKYRVKFRAPISVSVPKIQASGAWHNDPDIDERLSQYAVKNKTEELIANMLQLKVITQEAGKHE